MRKWTLPLVLGWLLWGVSKLGGPLFQLPLLLAVLFEGVARALPRAHGGKSGQPCRSSTYPTRGTVPGEVLAISGCRPQRREKVAQKTG